MLVAGMVVCRAELTGGGSRSRHATPSRQPQPGCMARPTRAHLPDQQAVAAGCDQAVAARVEKGRGGHRGRRRAAQRGAAGSVPQHLLRKSLPEKLDGSRQMRSGSGTELCTSLPAGL